MNQYVGKPKVIVFGSEQFSDYLKKKNPNWYVQPPSDDVYEFWSRIDLYETDPSNPQALDPDSDLVFFQNIYNSPDDLDENVAGTASSFIHYGKVKTFAFGDDEFFENFVNKVKRYDYQTQKSEGVENPILNVDTIHLTDDNENSMLKVLISETSDIVDWSHLVRPQTPPSPSRVGPQTVAPSNVAEVRSETVTTEPKPQTVRVENYSETSESTNYTIDTVRRATENYNKPADAIPDQLTIAVMSSKGGSGKCVRGDMLVPLSDGSFRSVESLVGFGLDSSRSPENVEVLAFNGATVGSERVVNFFRSGVRETFTVRLASGRWVSATSNHPFLTAGGWKEVKDLKVGETVASVAKTPQPVNVVNPSRVDVVSLAHRNVIPTQVGSGMRGESFMGELEDIPDEVFRYGFESLTVFLSEIFNLLTPPSGSLGSVQGSPFVSPGSPLIFGFKSSTVVAEKLRSLFLRLGVVVVNVGEEDVNDAGYKVELLSEEDWKVTTFGVADFSVENFINNVTVPPEVFKECEIFGNFLHVNGVRCTQPTLDVDAIAGVQHVLLTDYGSGGLNEMVKDTILANTRVDVGADGFPDVSDSLPSLNLGFLKSWGVASGNGVGEHYGWIASGDIYWDPVVAVVSEGEHETYDIEVPSVHNFVANGVIVHNSTTAMMLASTIAKTTRAAGNPKKVVLVDLDTRDGQVGTLLGQYKPTAINLRVIPTKKRTGVAVQNNLVHDPKLEIDALLAPVRPRFAADIGPDFYEQIIGVLQTTHDVVVIDCSVNYLDPLLGSAFKVSDNILFVTTLALTSVQGMARALIEMTESREDGGLDIPKDKIKVVVNQVTKDVGMPAPRLVKSLLDTEVVGKIPNLPKSVLIATNEAKMWRLFELDQLAASYTILARKCLDHRPHWKMRIMKGTGNFQGIKNMIKDGKLLPPD